jgi:DNA-binding GntR family transcriptional regulator
MQESSTALNAPTYVRLRERLRADIISGVWPLGQHVTLSDLSAHYQVSGNPIREALLHLEGDGVVSMRMHRGAVIPAVERRFVENVYDLNAAISVMLVRDAVRRLTPADLAVIDQAADAFDQATATGDVVAMVTANRSFHRAINAVADNPPALEVLRGRLSLIDALRVAIGYHNDRLAEIIGQHREIVAALRARKAGAAAAAVGRHIDSAKQNLLRHMDVSLAVAAPTPPDIRTRRKGPRA